MTKIFFDTEFVDTGSHLELISIGLERADGARYYAEVAEASLLHASPWVHEHVVAHLDANLAPTVKLGAQIAAEIVKFVGPDPTFYAYVDHYDWVLLSQLYGPLVHRPAGWPYGSIDLAEHARLAGIDPDEWVPPEHELPGFEHLPVSAHRADAGAAWAHRLYDAIQTRARDERDLAALVDGPYLHGVERPL